MSLSYEFTCTFPNGIHARPASALEERTRASASEIILTNIRTNTEVNAKSVLSIIGADIKNADKCLLIVNGPDEVASFKLITSFIENEFSLCDTPLEPLPVTTKELKLPVLLKNAQIDYLLGYSVCKGVGRGCIITSNAFPPTLNKALQQSDVSFFDWEKTENALSTITDSLEQKQKSEKNKLSQDLVQSQISIIRDPELHNFLKNKVLIETQSAYTAIIAVYEYYAKIFGSAESSYIRSRVIDVADICLQLLENIYGDALVQTSLHINKPSIVMAENLTPSQFLSLNKDFLCGMILKESTATSHVAILARSMGIPTVAGISDERNKLTCGNEIILDANLGIVVTSITDSVARYYELEKKKFDALGLLLREKTFVCGKSADGIQLEIAANISSSQEAEFAFKQGAQSIGLMRTEMLFLDRTHAPTENEQFEEYRRVVQSASEKSVILRMLDIGGDKPLPYKTLLKEENPFLGLRGVRLYTIYSDLIVTQLRAIIRASAFGNIRVMIPMVTCVHEIQMVREIITKIQKEFVNTGVAFNPNMEVGIMVEVPAAAFSLNTLSSLADFFSIGTNDLAQYFFAADRGNTDVSSLANYRDPAFISFIWKIVKNAHKEGKWVGICGEMASDQMMLPLFLGMGINEISMASVKIPSMKTALSHLIFDRCQLLLESLMLCKDGNEVSLKIKEFTTHNYSQKPILDQKCIIVNSFSKTKEEVIKEAADLLFLCNRTNEPSHIEDALWQREAVYSTGLGYGFAIPHCKSDALCANSIVVIKPITPIAWGSLDDKPVSVIIFLALRAMDADKNHMAIFAKLARKIMHEDFRISLLNASNSLEIKSILDRNLEVVG